MVEHPMYMFMTYCVERLPILVKTKANTAVEGGTP